MGYARAGFKVSGVDIDPQPHYPFDFTQADVTRLRLPYLLQFDFIHASPPCQRYSTATKRSGIPEEWPDLVGPVRELLRASGKPYIIENVEGAPLENPITLCGTMFPGLRVLRHRLFESNVPLVAPPHGKHPLCFTHDKRKAHCGKLDEMKAFVQVTGGGNCSVAAASDAMGINWMTKGELNESIPPAYTEYLGRQIVTYLEETQT